MIRILGVVLAASIALNIALWLRRGDAGATDEDRTRANVGLDRAAAPTAGSPPTPDCIRKTGALQKQLLEVEHRIEQHLTIDDRFDRGAPSDADEAKLRALLAAKLGKSLDLDAIAIECRGGACRFTYAEDDVPADFSDKFREATAGLFTGIQNRVTSDMDPVRNRVVATFDRTGLLASSVPQLGTKLLAALTDQLAKSPATAECKQRFPDPGYVDFKLDIDPPAARIVVEQGGSLAPRPAGDCIRRVLDGMISATPVPPGTGSVPNWYFRIGVPE